MRTTTRRQRISDEYKGYLLCVHRIGTGGEYHSYAMKLSAPGKLTAPFAGRLEGKTESGTGARQRAYERIRGLVDAEVSL